MSAPALTPAQLSGYITFGPKTNCTIAVCPIEWTVYQYQPSIIANSLFLALFAVSMFIHIVQGIRWKTWAFTVAMSLGCVCEILGYGGRIMLYENPFSFNGFLMQIILITLGPAFFSAAIYLTLYRIVMYLDPSISRFSPRLLYWIFIPCDLVSLVLQANGGALSSTSGGASAAGVNIAIAGLVFQVFTLSVFILLAGDYAVRYLRSARGRAQARLLPTSFRVFVAFLSTAIVLILVRCVYRIDELSNGYNGPLISDEGLFIALEGVMIILAAFCLNVAHPGPVFPRGEVAVKGSTPSSLMEEAAIAPVVEK